MRVQGTYVLFVPQLSGSVSFTSHQLIQAQPQQWSLCSGQEPWGAARWTTHSLPSLPHPPLPSQSFPSLASDSEHFLGFQRATPLVPEVFLKLPDPSWCLET